MTSEQKMKPRTQQFKDGSSLEIHENGPYTL
jgi:hypothetical protein